jgi:hypothetical protein
VSLELSVLVLKNPHILSRCILECVSSGALTSAQYVLSAPTARVTSAHVCAWCSPRTQAPLFKFAFTRTHHTFAVDARAAAAVRIKQMREARALQLLLHGWRVFVSQPVTSGTPSHRGAYQQHFALYRNARHSGGGGILMLQLHCVHRGCW